MSEVGTPSRDWTSVARWAPRRAIGIAARLAGKENAAADRWLLLRWDRRLLDLRQPMPLVIPILLLLLATLLFRTTTIDLAIASLFHDPAAKTGFPLAFHSIPCTLYWWGLVPMWTICVLSIAAVIVGVVHRQRRDWARAGAFLVLALALGPGLLVNKVYKENWHRPRPDQITCFGGEEQFRFVLERGSEPGFFSFPSGHAAAGFFLMAPAFPLYRRWPKAAAMVLLLGLLAGTTMGLGRIMQGRHFASDVVWSAGLVYFTAMGLDYAAAWLWRPAMRTVAPSRSGTPRTGHAQQTPADNATTEPIERREAA